MKGKNFSSFFLTGIIFFFSIYTVNAQQLGDGLFARISTNKGDIIARLEYQRVPLTVCNFIALAEGRMNISRGRPYYNGLTFHRVVTDFIIQGGCPQGSGRGGPGYSFPDEIISSLKHDKPGVLSMANAGPGTNGSQFFITIAPASHLDGYHTVFGQVVQGQNIVNTIREGDRINQITIIRNGQAANSFRADQETFDRLLSQSESSMTDRLRVQRQAHIAQIGLKFPDAAETASGIRYIIQREGRGEKVTSGQSVTLNYTGSLLSGIVFDRSDVRGNPLVFQAGSGRVLQGLDETVLDMRTGERRLVIIPPELAYGSLDIGNGLIPANSFLVFELELLSAQ